MVVPWMDTYPVCGSCSFYRALDIFPPPDYNEPDQHLDRLPQPYRRIIKVMELLPSSITITHDLPVCDNNHLLLLLPYLQQ